MIKEKAIESVEKNNITANEQPKEILDRIAKGYSSWLDKAKARNEQPKEYNDFIVSGIYNHQCTLSSCGSFEVTKIKAHWREDLQCFLGSVYYKGLTDQLIGKTGSFHIGSCWGKNSNPVHENKASPAPSLAPVDESVEERAIKLSSGNGLLAHMDLVDECVSFSNYKVKHNISELTFDDILYLATVIKNL